MRSITRRVVGGSTINQPTEELRHVQTSGQPPLLKRAVVVEVMDSPGSLTEEKKQQIAEIVNNPEFVDVMPVNSILARLVNDSADLGSPTSTILFPFFSSNLLLPITPGEHVTVIYDDPSRSGGAAMGYWISRTSEQRTVEDVNYNVSDRRYDPKHNPQLRSTTDRNQQDDTEQVPLGFPNGGDTPSTLTLRTTGSNGQNPYDGIVQESSSIENFTFEPVPRYNKRPGEFVIQGKNNATIVLGEDRTGPVVRVESDTQGGQAGSIDLVVGRGRKLPETDTEDPEGTAPRVITNSRDKRETNKVPYLSEGRQDNPREGDPDFLEDAARVLVSMQSEADKNFGITGLTFPVGTLAPSQPNEGTPGTLNKSYVVAKADHIRLIARKNDEVQGTVLVVREGQGEEDLAYLYINPSGELQVFAPKIYLGKATGEAEPYIKWTEFKKTVDKLQEQINKLQEFCGGLVQELQTAFAGAIAVPYSPISTLTQAVVPITTKKETLNGALPSLKSAVSDAVENSKSTSVFGS